MKTLLAVGVLMIALAVMAQTAPTLLPESIPFTLEWEHEREEPGVYYMLYAGTNLTQTISTNDFTTVGITNGLSTLRAQINGFPKGTNVLTLAAVSPTFGTNSAAESDPSTPIAIRVLGKPLAPQALRKP